MRFPTPCVNVAPSMCNLTVILQVRCKTPGPSEAQGGPKMCVLKILQKSEHLEGFE
jgi:hypothetical protein